MKTLPEDVVCEICGSPATVQLVNKSNNSENLYCKAHQPELAPPGMRSDIAVKRFRLPPNNAVSKKMAADEHSPEHEFFRIEMCDVHLLGHDGACKYYLSRLTGSDQFALWGDEFVDNMREYVVAETNGAAAGLPFDGYSVGFMEPFLKDKFEASRSEIAKLNRKELAVVLLLKHPEWSDERIATHVPTTVKQLRRNSDFAVLRSLYARNRSTIQSGIQVFKT